MFFKLNIDQRHDRVSPRELKQILTINVTRISSRTAKQ